jgi:hypothetical protein
LPKKRDLTERSQRSPIYRCAEPSPLRFNIGIAGRNTSAFFRPSMRRSKGRCCGRRDHGSENRVATRLSETSTLPTLKTFNIPGIFGASTSLLATARISENCDDRCYRTPLRGPVRRTQVFFQDFANITARQIGP